MNFDPFQFYSNGNDFFNDFYGGYNNGYDDYAVNVMTPIYWIFGLIIAAVVIGIVLNVTFLSRKNEGRFHGFWGKVYNCLSFNRFYSEGITKLLGVITFLMLTFLGLYMVFTGSVVTGILTIVFGNLAARLGYELIMMFIILCKKSVSIDKRVSAIEKYYSEDEEDWDVEDPKADGIDEMAEPQGADEADFTETALAAEAMVVEPKEEPAPVDSEFEKKLRETLGDPEAPKYGYDEECQTCDKFSVEEQDCYCPDDCLTCEKPDQDKADAEKPEPEEVSDPEVVAEPEAEVKPEEEPEVTETPEINE
ncbi:MAG: hypothetical protein II918_07545 [Firmicutes bacterium]|nr:hypothetical protein [Bacillota bacterium]